MEPPSSHRIDVLNQSGRRLRIQPLKKAVSTTLDRHGRSNASVSLLLTGDAEIRQLNLEFRGLDETTDVLTFPAPDFPGAPLGEIAISVPYAELQAVRRSVSLQDELAYLAIHGALHLLGFDDEAEDDRRQMHAEMEAIGRELGLPPEPAWSSLLHAEAHEVGT
jgi:probable rRNA maturation factor